MKYSLIILCFITLTSCQSQEKREKQVRETYKAYLEMVDLIQNNPHNFTRATLNSLRSGCFKAVGDYNQKIKRVSLDQFPKQLQHSQCTTKKD